VKNLIGLAGLGRLLESGSDFSVIGPELEARVAQDPADASAMLDIATLCFMTGNDANVPFALQHQARALELARVFRLPAPPRTALRLVVVMAPGDNTANTPVDCLVERSDIELTLVYVRPEASLPALPPHDLVFVAIGESSANDALLHHLPAALAARTDKPVVNAPAGIRRTLRDRAAALLAPEASILMPATVRVPRSTLQAIGRRAAFLRDVAGVGQFPIIARPVDSQGGKDLARIDNADGLADYLARVASLEFFIARFVDYRSADGQFRKDRVVLVDGQPFASHRGISDHWLVHYISARMDLSPEKRRDEETWFATFDRDYAARHRAAFAAIRERLGLDYLTIDCADAPDGRLLVFEVDNAALVHDLDDPVLYPYKRPAMRRVFGAFRAMLFGRAGIAPA